MSLAPASGWIRRRTPAVNGDRATTMAAALVDRRELDGEEVRRIIGTAVAVAPGGR